jgi:uncharacterized membrane protein YheB (UPF0754 family)
MINLNDDQVRQLDQNIESAIEDLHEATFETDDSTPLLAVGANIGMALQKLKDVRQFLLEKTIEDTDKAMVAKEEHMKQMSTSADPLIERQTREEKIYQAINEKLKKNFKP